MQRLNITAKIWLSVGVFIFGYVLSTALTQFQGREARASLQVTSDALFPAAQLSQEAESAFQRMVKGFSDAVVMQDASALDRAAEDGRQSVTALKAIASVQGLSSERSVAASAMASAVQRILADAGNTYGAVLHGAMSDSTQDQIRRLAARTDDAKANLARTKEQLAGDLHNQLSALRVRSAREESLALWVFGITLVVAGAIVHFTVRESITGPVFRVIAGVQEAANEAARAAGRMADSGLDVSNNAQEQSACVEQTSASLEELSATTRQNADRAGEADGLMQTAHKTVERAGGVMNDLTLSMNLISKSSNEVSKVLKDIDEIAFHTNILALNAAVEAARAGESGLGFSVVADEVRSLAHRAADAARNSGAIIERTLGDVSKGVALVAHTRDAFHEVSGTITAGTRIVSQIAVSSVEQAKGITQIGQAITRIESLTQRNAANAQRTAEGAAAMTSQVDNTRSSLAELAVLIGVREA